MAHVTLSIAGRPYQVACGDGQEEQVLELGNELDRRARLLSSVNGAVSEGLLLVLVGLMVADEAVDLRAHATSAEENYEHLKLNSERETIELRQKVSELELRLVDLKRALDGARQRLEQQQDEVQTQREIEDVMAQSIEALASRIETVADVLAAVPTVGGYEPMTASH